MPKAQPRARFTPTALQAVLADIFSQSPDCLSRLETLWQAANAATEHRQCLWLAAVAVNQIHHAWSSFAGLNDWLNRLARDLAQEAAITDAADKIRIHCAAMFAHPLSNVPFADTQPINERLNQAIALLIEHGATLPVNELFSASRSLLDFIEIENEPDGFEAILMLLEARKHDPDLNALWRGRALVYGGRCYLRFNLEQKSKRFRERALKLWKEAHELARTHNLRTVQFDVAYAEILDATTRGEFDAVPLLLADMEAAFVRATVAQRKLPPPALDCAAWPWPLEITTFGGFALKRFGEPMPFEGKVQKKPLELLKSIVSVGRRGISIHLLCEMLWPDSAPEQARTAFKVTLSRLRKLLDVANAFAMTDTRIALNNEVVRVDCARFEVLGDALEMADTTVMSRAPEMIVKAPVPPVTALAQQFVSVYRGRFLGNEPANRWLQSARERWHTRFVRVVIGAGARIEAEHAIDVAISLYERAVEHDALSEELHRRLIAAYLLQGEHAEAINAFRRLRHNLSLTLGVMPSEKTLALIAPWALPPKSTAPRLRRRRLPDLPDRRNRQRVQKRADFAKNRT